MMSDTKTQEAETMRVAEAFAARLDGAAVFFVRIVGERADLTATAETVAAGVAIAARYPRLRQAGGVTHAGRGVAQRVFVFEQEG